MRPNLDHFAAPVADPSRRGSMRRMQMSLVETGPVGLLRKPDEEPLRSG